MPRSRLRAALSRAERGAVPSLALALGLFAYRPLFLDALRVPASSEVEQWLFAPEEKSPLLAIGVAGWLLWRRRPRLLSLPDRGGHGVAVALLAVGVVLFAWARLTAQASLLLPSLAANLLAFACAAKGRAGCRALLLPAAVLLLGVPIPVPLRNELAWQLQLWSARGATWLLQIAGSDALLQGVVIHSGEYTFTVIESCSGLSGVEILTLVAIAIRELFAASGRRAWLVVLVAPWLGVALNVLRVAVVAALAASGDPEAGAPENADHTLQGVALLVAGTALLYGLGRALAGSGGRRVGAASRPSAGSGPVGPAPRSRAVAAWLAVLAAASVALRPLPEAPRPSPIELPDQLAGWSGADLPLDRLFVGPLRGGEALHRRYERKLRDGSPEIVDLLLGYEVPENSYSRFFSPKLRLPGHEWSLTEIRPTRVWSLGFDAELAVVSRDSEHRLVYTWRVRDGGIWRETSRAALALESGPFRRERRRAVVRLATPLAQDGPVARDRAKRTLDRFIADFRDALAGL